MQGTYSGNVFRDVDGGYLSVSNTFVHIRNDGLTAMQGKLSSVISKRGLHKIECSENGRFSVELAV